MLPKIWGKYGWNFGHLVTMGYPEYPTRIDMENYRNFFESLKFVLPCAECRKNYIQNLKRYPLTDEVLSSRKTLIKWFIDLHNIVNYHTGKKMLSYNEAINELSKLINPVQPKNDYLIYILLIIAIIIIIVMFYYYKKIDH